MSIEDLGFYLEDDDFVTVIILKDGENESNRNDKS